MLFKDSMEKYRSLSDKWIDSDRLSAISDISKHYLDEFEKDEIPEADKLRRAADIIDLIRTVAGAPPQVLRAQKDIIRDAMGESNGQKLGN